MYKKPSCSICRVNRCERTIHFFTVPKNEGRHQLWNKACGKELKESSKICSKHFLEKDFIELPENKNNKRARLYPNAVPSVFLSCRSKEKPTYWWDDPSYKPFSPPKVESPWFNKQSPKPLPPTKVQTLWCKPCPKPLATPKLESPLCNKSCPKPLPPTKVQTLWCKPCPKPLAIPKVESPLYNKPCAKPLHPPKVESSSCNKTCPKSLLPPKVESQDPIVSRLLSNRKALSVSVKHISKLTTEPKTIGPTLIESTPIEPKINCSSESKICTESLQEKFAHDLVKACINERKKTGPIKEIHITGIVNENGKVCFDSCTQTDDDYQRAYGMLENMDMRKKVRILEFEIEKLQQELEDSQCIYQNLNSIFTEGQLRKLRCPDKSIHWSRDDITSATNLHAAGHNAYMYLYKRGFPLPSLATIKKWAQKKRKLEKELLQMSDNVMSDNENFIDEQNDDSVDDEFEKLTVMQPEHITEKVQKLLSIPVENSEPTNSKSVSVENAETTTSKSNQKLSSRVAVKKAETTTSISKQLKTPPELVRLKKEISSSECSNDIPYEEIKIEETVISADFDITQHLRIPITMDMMEDKEDLSDDEKISVRSFDEIKRDDVVLSYDKIKVKEEASILLPDDFEEYLL